VIGRPPPSELASPSHVLAMGEDGQVWLTGRRVEAIEVLPNVDDRPPHSSCQ
jgi:hypothetical protein